MLCRYERTIFKSDKGFCIFSYSTEDQSVPKEAHNRSFYHDDKIHFTAIGYHLVASNAVEVELDGTWENSKHGLQLSVSMCKEIVPTNQAGILAYLSSGVIKGVGPEIAKAIVARFGDKTMEVLDKEPQKLLSIKGIAQRKLKAIIASYEETKALSDLMIYLAPFGVSMKKAAMIKEEFGDNSLKIVKSDPFQLCKIKGFGFMTVDSIARKTKVSLKHPMRYSGAINYVLDEARVSGHLFLTVDETVGQCYDLLNSDCEEEVVSEEEIRQAITNERVESRVYVEGSRVYLSYERMCEVKAAKRIVSMLLQEGFDEIRDLDEKIDRAEKNLHQRLAPSQRNAVKLCLSYPISIMTGGPGSGKTTTLRFILDIYQAAFPSNEILLAAPTGRASRRMSEQTGKYASTLHSALGLVTEEDSPLNDTEMLSADLAKCEQRREKLAAEIARYRDLKASLYEDMKEGLISKTDFCDIRGQYDARIADALIAQEQIDRELSIYLSGEQSPNNWMKTFTEHRGLKSLTRAVVLECIEKVVIHKDEKLEIIFEHSEDYARLVSSLQEYAARGILGEAM